VEVREVLTGADLFLLAPDTTCLDIQITNVGTYSSTEIATTILAVAPDPVAWVVLGRVGSVIAGF
jgi:hypothetical protein